MLDSNNQSFSNTTISIDTGINNPCCYKGCNSTITESRFLFFIKKPVFLCLKHKEELEKCGLVSDSSSSRGGG